MVRLTDLLSPHFGSKDTDPRMGYVPVFQTLIHTLGLGTGNADTGPKKLLTGRIRCTKKPGTTPPPFSSE
jgi:hypothetical protein